MDEEGKMGEKIESVIDGFRRLQHAVWRSLFLDYRRFWKKTNRRELKVIGGDVMNYS